MYALGVTVGAVLIRDGWSPWAAAAAVLVLSALLWAGNALVATYVGLPTFIVTLASLMINSSVAGLTAAPGISGYAAAKHAQVGLMRVAARECAARGVRVNTIHPGPIDIPFMRRIETVATGQPSEHAARAFDAMIPLGRHAAPEEIARTVLHLAGDDASFTTGATVAVDGGMSV